MTANRREIKDFPKLSLATSFIRETSGKLREINKNGQFQ